MRMSRLRTRKVVPRRRYVEFVMHWTRDVTTFPLHKKFLKSLTNILVGFLSSPVLSNATARQCHVVLLMWVLLALSWTFANATYQPFLGLQWFLLMEKFFILMDSLSIFKPALYKLRLAWHRTREHWLKMQLPAIVYVLEEEDYWFM